MNDDLITPVGRLRFILRETALEHKPVCRVNAKDLRSALDELDQLREFKARLAQRNPFPDCCNYHRTNGPESIACGNDVFGGPGSKPLKGT